MPKKYKLHLVSHTHWDREWYLSFQQFRMRLVDMVDSLLDTLDADEEYRYFTLDGQTILLDDYLEVRPENERRLKKYIRTGKILIGPWYNLADEFLVGGESLIRNLFWGHKSIQDWAPVTKVGYMPDQFGLISQMPQILRGFGIDNAIFWRGLGISWKKTGSEFIWQGPDGTKILAHRLPPGEGYFNAVDLPEETDKACRRVEELKEQLCRYRTTNNLLLMNGQDHRFAQTHIPALIKKLNTILKDAEIIHSSLPLFIQSLKKSKPRLKTVKGEFYSGRYSRVHPGVLSSRIHLKQVNTQTENLLQKWAEPFSALAWVGTRSYPEPFLNLAWKYLLRNHPHDSICGCSIDEVDEEMMTRFSVSRQISEELTSKALHQIGARIDTSFLKDDETALVVFNSLNWSRSDWVKAKVTFPKEMNVENFSLEDSKGNPVPYHLHRSESYINFFSPVKYLTFEKASRFEVSFFAEDVPSLGYRVYLVKPRVSPQPLAPDNLLSPEQNILENEYLRVTIKKNGTFDLLDKKSNIIYEGCHYFEDGGDKGTLYNYSYPENDRVITSLKQDASITLMENTEFSARYKIETGLALPLRLSPDRKRRSKELVNYPITSYVSLYSGVPRVEIETRLRNRAQDHRLRVLFPSGVETDFSYAQGQFDVLRRPVKVPDSKDWAEDPMPTYPQRAFVDVSDKDRGMGVLNQGLAEYEVKDDKERTIALTLLRCVEWVTAPGLLTVRTHKGEPFWQHSPAGQCPGDYVFRYALYPHSGNWQTAKVYQQAYQHNIGCRVIQVDKHNGKLPAEQSFVSIEPDNLIVSCLKKTETRNSLILRVFNISGRKVGARVKFYGNIKNAYLVNLNEKRERKLTVRGGTVSFAVPRKKIYTIEIVSVNH